MSESPDELASLADALRSLRPTRTTFSRDRLLYEMGRTSQRRALRFWQRGMACVGLWALAVTGWLAWLLAHRESVPVETPGGPTPIGVPTPILVPMPIIVPTPTEPPASSGTLLAEQPHDEASRNTASLREGWRLRQQILDQGADALPWLGPATAPAAPPLAPWLH